MTQPVRDQGGLLMLSEHPVDVMLLATDLAAARRFYHDTLGLQVLLEDEQFLTFRCGHGSRLIITHSTTGTTDQATKACWRVADIASEVAQLKARGVHLQDLPHLGTTDAIADIGFALAAWFTDPGHNSLSLLQLK